MNRSRAKVAIVQNKLGIDGRSRVVVEMIELLNQRGIQPDVFVLTGKNLSTLVKQVFDKPSLDFQVQSMLRLSTLKTATIMQEVVLNLLLRRKIRQYDVVINSNDSLSWWPAGPQYIHYIYLPPKATMAVSRPIHRQALWFLYRLLLWFLEDRAPIQLKGAILIAISKYTAELIKRYYGVPEDQIRVIYPPATRGKIVEASPRQGVVSCGAFSPRKRQLDQLWIAKMLPDLPFVLLGAMTNSSYLKRCRNFVLENKLNNVTLVPDAPAHVVTQTLASSRCFLHTRQYEEFGIAIVEAIESGCIPIVHDSGGPREIVPIAELRYQNLEEAVERIHSLPNLPSDILPKLQLHIQQFSSPVFQEHLGEIFDQVLD